MDISTLDKKATQSVWREVSNTHIDDIKGHLVPVINYPNKYLSDENNIKLNEYIIQYIESIELEYVIEKYYSEILPIFRSDIKQYSYKKNKKKTQQKSKKEIIIEKNIKKKLSDNRYNFYIAKKLYLFNTNKSVCELINICIELNKFKLINTVHALLDNYKCSNDLDNILQNFHIWIKKESTLNFKLTKCQKSIIKFVLEYCESPDTSYKSILEMSNTGSGKTVGLILAMGILWKKKLYNECVSHSFITRNSRKHSVKLPTKIIIAILPASVITFVQSALTSMNVPWAYVTPTSTAILDEFNPISVINYRNESRREFGHFCSAGSTAPCIYLTTESPTPEYSIFNCIKAAYKTVFSNIKKYTDSDKINLDNYISYNPVTNTLSLGKFGSLHCPYDPNTFSVIIGDDMETIQCFTQLQHIFNDNMLKIITTATPGGLSKTINNRSIKNRLPPNTYIPNPQDEIRNSGGIELKGMTSNINVFYIGYIYLFKNLNRKDKYLNYKLKTVFEYFIYGLFERKYIISFIKLLCENLHPKLKQRILHRTMFFDTTHKLDLNIDIIIKHIMNRFCFEIKNNNSEFIQILLNFNSTKNTLWNTKYLVSQLSICKNRGIILHSPNFYNNKNEHYDLVNDLCGDESKVLQELNTYNTNYNKYLEQKNKLENQYNKGKSIDGSSKNHMNQIAQYDIAYLDEPTFPTKYHIFSKEHLSMLGYPNISINSDKTKMNKNQFHIALETNDIRLAQGILSINPTNQKKLQSSLKNYTHGSHDNIKLIQFLTDIFNTRQLILGANPPNKLNIVIANYEFEIDGDYINIFDGKKNEKYPKISVINLLIQICGRIGRGINSMQHNYIYTTSSVASILITTTPNTMLYNEYDTISICKLQTLIRKYMVTKK